MNCSWEQSSCVSLHKKWQLLHVCVAAMQSTCTALYKFTCRAREVDPGRPGALAVQVMARLNASYDSCHFVTRRVHTLTQRGMLWHGAYVCLSVRYANSLTRSINTFTTSVHLHITRTTFLWGQTCGPKEPCHRQGSKSPNLQLEAARRCGLLPSYSIKR